MKTPGADKPLARVSRRAVSAGLLAAPALIAGWRRAAAAEPVAAGVVNPPRGGRVGSPTSFRAAGAMMAPLGSRELDVGADSVTPGIFNANERASPIRIVAD